jgi:threonine/homoserine/homoserine lactone efflux protein
MDATLFAAAAAFALVSTITPGPNNLMLAASGLNFGLRRTLPLLIGIIIGFQGLLWAVAAGLGAVFAAEPALQWLLRFGGAAYLLYLAWALWRASSGGERALAQPIGFVRGVLFQAVNPKAWVMTIGAISAYTLSLLFLVLGTPAIGSWAAFGAGFRAALSDPATARRVGRAMAVLTAASCVMIFI